MSMKNNLINHINTKVSAPDMKYSELINSGANTLDKAFQPHKNTNEIVTLDNHLQSIRENQLGIMENLAIQEQNKMTIDVLNKKFEADNKAINELGANLFTYGGTKLDGTEDKYIQDIMKDFEKQTGRKDFNIDDIIRNVNDSQLALSSDLKDRINQYSDYKYNKAKIDNRMLDTNDINKLAEENYPKYGRIGQDLNSFKTLFTNNSNSINDVITDKINKKKLEESFSGKDLEAERMLKLIQDRLSIKNKETNSSYSNNNQNNTSQNTNDNRVNSNKNTNNKVNNKNTNEDTNKDANDNQFIIDDMNRKALIQYHTDREKINSNLLNTDDKIKEGYELIKNEDPNLQRAMVQNIITISGVERLLKEQGNLSLTKKVPPLIHRSDTPESAYKDVTYYDGEDFISDLLSKADSGNILTMRLDGYNVNHMPKGVAEVYKTIEKLQYLEVKKYNHILDKAKDIANDVDLMSTSQVSESNEEYKKYIDNGIKLKEVDENIEKNIKITDNGIFTINNETNFLWLKSLGVKDPQETRDLHQNEEDIRYRMSNNILNRLYNNYELMPEIVYFLSTSDSVIELRNKYFSTPDKTKITTKMFKNPKEAKKLINEMRDALDNAKVNLKLPKGANAPKLADLAQMIFLVDLSIMPNYDHFRNNPASLGKVYETIQNSINPDNLANISNNIKE